jgi:diguanylate cyclase (GGDEF)-like protein
MDFSNGSSVPQGASRDMGITNGPSDARALNPVQPAAARRFADGPWRELGLRLFPQLQARRSIEAGTVRLVLNRIGLMWHAISAAFAARCTDLPVIDTTLDLGRLITEPTEIDLTEDTPERDSTTLLRTGETLTRSLEDAIEQATKEGERIAVLMVSVNRLEGLNAFFGRKMTDGLLRQIAERLESVPELGQAAYRAANRFVFFTMPGTDTSTTDAVHRLETMLEQPFKAGANQYQLSLAVGIAQYPDHGMNASALLHAANFARQCAKGTGEGDSVSVWCDPTKWEEQRQRFALETELRQAINSNELRLYYQPKVKMPGQRLVGFEALLRWQHPTRGLLGPGDFLDIAETANLMRPITGWAIRMAARQIRAWIAAGLTPVPIAVNIPPNEFVQRLLTEHLPAYERYGVPVRLLDLEITESQRIEDLPAFLKVADVIRQRGIKLAMDDFGTGYSSLSGLSALPITTLKIDQSFTRQLTTDRGVRAISAGIASIARELDLELVAEGVETSAQLKILQSMGFHIFQGYLTGRPMPPEQAATLLKSTSRRQGGRFARVIDVMARRRSARPGA